MFVCAILIKLVDDDDLPSVTEVRACLEVDVDSLTVSGAKLRAMRDEFGSYLDQFAEAAVFDEHLAMVRSFMFVVVEEILAASGMKEEVTYHRSVGCPAVLLRGDVSLLLTEAEQFNGLLMDLRRIGLAEKRRMNGSFVSFVTTFRGSAVDMPLDSASSAVDI